MFGAAARDTVGTVDAVAEALPWLADDARPAALWRRPVTRYDADLLTALFTDWRSQDFAALPISLGSALIDMQFQAHQHDRLERWPDAADEIIEVYGIPAGRVTTVVRGRTLRIIDLMLFNGFRAQGVGRETVQVLYEQAERAGLRLVATVPATALEVDAQWVRWVTNRSPVGDLDVEIELRLEPLES